MIAFGQAFAYTWSGMYGDIAVIGAGNAILIILQLVLASVEDQEPVYSLLLTWLKLYFGTVSHHYHSKLTPILDYKNSKVPLLNYLSDQLSDKTDLALFKMHSSEIHYQI